jgi:hypothetical protein
MYFSHYVTFCVSEFLETVTTKGVEMNIGRLRLCPDCLTDFKREFGKQARKANGGTWRGMVWPDRLYHTNQESKLCVHHTKMLAIHLGRAYSERTTFLLSLGFMSYPEYRKSEFWNSIRKRVFARDAGLCRFCEETATEVHHQKYDLATLKGDDLKFLHSVCRDCHEFGEFLPNGDKCPPAMATSRMVERGIVVKKFKKLGRPLPELIRCYRS